MFSGRMIQYDRPGGQLTGIPRVIYRINFLVNIPIESEFNASEQVCNLAQRVYPINIPLNHYKIPLNHYKSSARSKPSSSSARSAASRVPGPKLWTGTSFASFAAKVCRSLPSALGVG